MALRERKVVKIVTFLKSVHSFASNTCLVPGNTEACCYELKRTRIIKFALQPEESIFVLTVFIIYGMRRLFPAVVAISSLKIYVFP